MFLTNGVSMSALWKGLLVVSLSLATVTVGYAEQAAEGVPSIPQEPGVTDFTHLAGAGQKPEARNASGDMSATMVEPAVEIIKVSKLETSVALPAVMTAEDRQLELRKADFLKFAEVKLRDMNRNHILSRERMRIQKRSDGSYQASFHQLDDSSMACEVRRSPTKAAPYVAVLSYQERVYAASCGTPAECQQGNFVPVEMIPNRHIFVYKNGAWQ